MATLGLKNVNILSKEQYDGIAEPVKDELWTVEIETYSDDDGNWYRVYPDGWCEQGGLDNTTGSGTLATVTLLKPFKDANYFVTRTNLSGTTYNGYSGYVAGVQTRTNTSFTFKTDSAATYSNGNVWEARGYIA